MSVDTSQIRFGVIYMRQALVSAIFPFLVMLVVARTLLPEDFGVYALVQIYAIVMISVASIGLHIGYERNHFKYNNVKEKKCQLRNSVLLITSLLYVVCFMITMYFGASLLEFIGLPVEISLLKLIFIGLSVEKLAQFYLIYYRSVEAVYSYTNCLISVAIINSAVSLYLVSVLKIGIVGIAWGYCLSWCVVFSYMIISEFKLFRYGLNWEIMKEVLILSLPITPRSITILISTQSDKYMLGVLGNMGSVGMYSLAMRLSTVLNTYMIALQNVYTPHIFKILFLNDSKERQKLGPYLTRITYLSLFPAVVLALFASEIIWILFPVGYIGLDSLLSVLSVYYGVMFFGKITSKQLVYAEKTGLITKLSIFFSLFNVALNIPLIYFFGALGAVFSTLINGALYTYFSFILAQKHCHIEWEINIIFLLTAYLFLCCLMNFGISLLNINFQTILIFKVLLFSYYIYIGCTLGVLTKNNIMKVAFFLKKR